MTLLLEGVGFGRGAEVHIHPTTLELERGTMNVLLGPTLAGKTSLMRLMAGLDRPTEGRIIWNGADVTGVPVQKRQIAMVYQQFINYPTLTVYENIASPLRIQRKPRDEIDNAVRETADLLKLGPMLERKPLELSGGQQQRCALARALVKRSELVLLDEPLANLDYKLREELREEIPRIFAESGAIFVYATTEPHEALLLGGNTACLWEGRVLQLGPTSDVYRRPADAITARVFSDPPMNFLPVRKNGSRISLPDGREMEAPGAFAELADGGYTAGFRPSHLSLERNSPDALGFAVVVAVTEITGSESFIHVDYDDRRWVALVGGVHEMGIGAPMEVFVDPRHLYIFGEDGRLIAAASFARAA